MRGSVRKVERKNGHKWRATVDLPRGPDENRKQKGKIFDTKTEAERWLAQINNEINQGGYFVPSESSLREFLDYWLEEYAKVNVKKSTWTRYQGLIQNHINPELGNIPLQDVSAMALRKFYNHKLEDGRLDGKEGGLASNTVRQMHAILHKAFETAKKWRMVKNNPADLVEAPRQESKEMKTLTSAQVQTLLEAAEEDSPYGPVYHLACYLGLRRSEVLGLRWDDVDMEEGKIHINQGLHQTTGGEIYFDDPKTKESRRTLRLPEQAVGILKRHRQRQNKRRMRKGPAWDNEHNLVFTAKNGHPIRPRNLYRDFKALLEQEELPNIPFHNLRHSCATLLLEQGEHPKVVQSILGHKSIQTTLDTYSHVSDDLQEKASQSLADSITQSNQTKGKK